MSSLLSVTVVTNRDSNMAVLSDITKDNTCNNLKKKRNDNNDNVKNVGG